MADAWEALRAAAADRERGSVPIARDAARALGSIASDAPDRIEAAVTLLVRGQPAMAACVVLADRVLRAGDAADAAHRFAGELDREAERLPGRLGPRVPSGGTVLTISASSSVLAGLRHTRPASVVCAVSSPGEEGRTAAAELSHHGLSVELVADVEIAPRAAGADLVVVGADAVGPDALLNKIGTLTALLGARFGGAPSIVVCGTTKILGAGGYEHVRAAASRIRDADRDLAPAPVFESVPLDLVDEVVTSDGILPADHVRELAADRTLDPRIVTLLGDDAP